MSEELKDNNPNKLKRTLLMIASLFFIALTAYAIHCYLEFRIVMRVEALFDKMEMTYANNANVITPESKTQELTAYVESVNENGEDIEH